MKILSSSLLILFLITAECLSFDANERLQIEDSLRSKLTNQYCRIRGINFESNGISVSLVNVAQQEIIALEGYPIETLVLEMGAVSLSPLKSLPLRSLALLTVKAEGGLSDVNSNLLESLWLNETSIIKDMGLISGFTNLTYLFVRTLESAYYSYTPMTNISFLAGMMRLEKLFLHGALTGDISALQNKRLKQLAITDNEMLSCLDVLKGMPLERLDIRGSAVSNLSALAGMKLEELNISNTHVTDISMLENMPLKRLEMQGAKINDLSPLKGMKLEELNISKTHVADISILENMPLKRLEMQGAKINDLSPLKGMKLEFLLFDYESVTNGMNVIKEIRSLQLVGTSDASATPPERFWASKGDRGVGHQGNQ